MSRLLPITVMLSSIGDQFRPPGASSWHEGSRAAIAPAVWWTCPKCKGDRVLVWKQRAIQCDHAFCEGQGGWYVDPYDQTRSPVSTESNEQVAPAKRIACLECNGEGVYPNQHPCRLCKGAGELVLWAADLAESLGERAGEVGREQGAAMVELLSALGELHVRYPAQHFAVWYSVVLELEPVEQLLLPVRNLVVRGVLNVDAMLPAGWREPPWARRRARELELVYAEQRRRARGTGRWADPARRAERDSEIRRLAANGRSLRQIASAMALGKSTVGKVLDREAEAA